MTTPSRREQIAQQRTAIKQETEVERAVNATWLAASWISTVGLLVGLKALEK